MLTPTTVYISLKQRKRLFDRTRRRKTSSSERLRAALAFYLDLPPDFDEKAFAALVREANAPMDRSTAKLDETLTFLEKFREAKA